MSDLIPGKDEDSEDKPDRYFHYMDDDGRLHVVDLLTGDIVKSAPEFEKGLVPGQRMSPQFIKGNSQFYQYNKIYCDLICQMISEGKTLTDIGKMPGFPSTSIIAQWRTRHEELENGIRAARRARAEGYADKIAESLEETRELNKDDIPAEKLYFDKLKYLAEKNDPQTYGTKNAGEHTPTQVNMVINTGVPLDDDDSPVTIEVEDESNKRKGT